MARRAAFAAREKGLRVGFGAAWVGTGVVGEAPAPPDEDLGTACPYLEAAVPEPHLPPSAGRALGQSDAPSPGAVGPRAGSERRVGAHLAAAERREGAGRADSSFLAPLPSPGEN